MPYLSDFETVFLCSWNCLYKSYDFLRIGISISFMRVFKKLFSNITDPENLFLAWDEFKRDKRNKADVLLFEKNLEQNIFALHRDVATETYRHGPYEGFPICDPKRRQIHKATVRDRVLHHAVVSVLSPIFEPTFIPTSFSCRIGKGTHRGVDYLAEAIRTVSRNYTRRCFILKCDIRTKYLSCRIIGVWIFSDRLSFRITDCFAPKPNVGFLGS